MLTAKAAQVKPATKEWAYSDLEDDYRANEPVWREVSESFYWQALGVLPPIYREGGFMVSEAWSHTSTDEPIYAGFASVGGRYFAQMCPVSQFPASARKLRNTLAEA